MKFGAHSPFAAFPAYAISVNDDRSNSWHAVAPLVQNCRLSRRSLTATFYHPGSVSTMWPPEDVAPLHDYSHYEKANAPGRWFENLRRLFKEKIRHVRN